MTDKLLESSRSVDTINLVQLADLPDSDVNEPACRCHRALAAPADRHWWPDRDPEPCPEVQVVVLYGDDPRLLHHVRVPGGWHTRGAAASHADCTPPQPWAQVGQCWDGTTHPVVDVTASTRELTNRAGTPARP